MSALIKIAELEDLDAAATPGEWRWENDDLVAMFAMFLSQGGVTLLRQVREYNGRCRDLIPAMRNALPALLRLARAAHRRRTAMLNNRGTHEDAIECSDADAEERAALDAFDFTIKEPAS